MLVFEKFSNRYMTCVFRILRAHVSSLMAGSVTAEKREKEKMKYETLTLHARTVLHRRGMICLTIPNGPIQREV
jgi:hypothetical protein